MHLGGPELIVLIVALGMLAQWLAWALKMPAIVLLLVAGLVAGPGLGVLDPRAQFGPPLDVFVRLAVAVILFEGGLTLRIHELNEAASGVKRLCSLGLVLSFAFGAVAAHLVGGLSWLVAMLFGAIVVVTGPTVIIPLLRQARLSSRAASLLKWEGIVNDPLGALLAVLVIEFGTLADPGRSTPAAVMTVAALLAAAALAGAAAGWLAGLAFRRGFVAEYLKPPLLLTVALLVFVATDHLLHEAGLLAATVMGVTVGNLGLPSMPEIRRFKESVTILLVSSLFVVLTANLDVATLSALDYRGLALIVVVIVVVRPLAIFLATIGADMSVKEKLLVGWIAPRGIVAAAVAGAFAPRLVDAGYEDARFLVPLVFALILVTVTLHGFSLKTIAKRLGLSPKRTNGVMIVGASAWSIDLAQGLKSLDVPVLVVDSSWHRLREARLAGLRFFYGEVISELAEASLDTTEIGSVFAVTDNDAYNALVCTHFAHELGRSAVWQLAMDRSLSTEQRGFMPALRGRPLFSAEAKYEELMRLGFNGWRFQKTRITETYDAEAYAQDLTAEVIAAVVVRSSGQVQPIAGLDDGPLAPGDVILNFRPAPERRDKKAGGPAPAETHGGMAEGPA